MFHVRVLSGAVALASVACVLVHEPPKLSPAEETALENYTLPKISVCVETPVLSADDETGGGEVQARHYYGRVSESSLLIEKLRGTGLFSRVDFAQMSDARCDVILVASRVALLTDVPLASAGVALAMFSQGVVPAVVDANAGVRFEVAGAPGDPLIFDWPTREVYGFPLPLVLALVPGWEMAPRGAKLTSSFLCSDKSAFPRCSQALALFLIAHRERIWPLVDPPP